MRKIVLSVLAILLVMWHTGAFAHAETTYSEGYFYYTVADESITITGYFGKEKEITLPVMIAGYPVNTIAAGAFQNTSAEKLLLPDTITSIEENAIGFGVSIVYNYNVGDDSVRTDNPEESTSAGSSEETAPQTPSDSQLEVVEVTLEEEETQSSLAATEETTVSESAEVSETASSGFQMNEEELEPDTEVAERKEAMEETGESEITTAPVGGEEISDTIAEPEKSMSRCIGVLVVCVVAAVAIALVTVKRRSRR